MSSASVAGYRAGTGQIFQYEGADGERFILVYNDTGATLVNGTVKLLDWTDDADSKGYYPTPGAPVEEAGAFQLIGVVNDTEGDTSGIADQEFGWLQVKGYCPAIIAAAGDVIDEHYLEVIAAGTAATDDGATLTSKSFGIAKGAAVAGASFAGVLFDQRVVVAGS
jgi:hypothetical protein